MNLTINALRNEIIGNSKEIQTPYGRRLLTYADYTASGRTVHFIEKYLLNLQESYANSHTEDSYTGKAMTTYLHQAENRIKALLHATDDHYVIPVGTGSTGAIQKLCEILGLYVPPKLDHYLEGTLEAHVKQAPVVFIGPYEHHSNDLIWRESIAEVVTIALNKEGGIDLNDLKLKLQQPQYNNRLKIGSFSAASNVSGVKSPLYEIAEILHAHDALACFDFAASGPYVEINMNYNAVSYFDAIYLSPHKFLGGPGSSGLLVIKKNIYDCTLAPTVAGGGTVDYVSSFGYDFTSDPESREKAGTPGILQILKTCLAMELKAEIGPEKIETIERQYIAIVMGHLSENSNIEILGPMDPNKRISILSFNIKYKDRYLHHRFVARLLNDLFGIQSRAGCACAGPYGHALLGIDRNTSEIFRDFISKGTHSLKPGWVRVNFHYAMSSEQVKFIIDAIHFVADFGYLFLQDYQLDRKSGAWTPKHFNMENTISPFGLRTALDDPEQTWPEKSSSTHASAYKQYMDQAHLLACKLKKTFYPSFQFYDDAIMESNRWFYILNMI
ncbi:aminotransferase class V-fold PLP-dependent enzyme [Fusibacter ferrireducens]|uniref:Aminotransferase class V-fold PLP-dependent enzyme n=1 Tax=Fusibacter ferrireducens TaxID=2785058 RepID=A0ABR9ZV12_9FIRM|nr:aminotransferase class V-fold PLP-dependent enzyme [Fusibacter ferrireducens]MBF4694191.1 aminotransferase class V-fold PLP-dependent enzyme [Fusibacter ferrireducens]